MRDCRCLFFFFCPKLNCWFSFFFFSHIQPLHEVWLFLGADVTLCSLAEVLTEFRSLWLWKSTVLITSCYATIPQGCHSEAAVARCATFHILNFFIFHRLLLPTAIWPSMTLDDGLLVMYIPIVFFFFFLGQFIIMHRPETGW